MQTEYETRVLNIDVENIKKTLEKLGAEFIGRFEQKRHVFHTANPTRGKWVRLRTNGKTTTLCYKFFESQTCGGVKEIEFEVPDFDLAYEFLSTIELPYVFYQENIRTQYRLDGVEIDIDEWPLVPAWLEVEGKNEKQVYDTLAKLGFSKGDTTCKTAKMIYRDEYGIEMDDIKELKFI